MRRPLRLLTLLFWCCFAFAPSSAWSVQQDSFTLVIGSNTYSWIDNASPTVTHSVSGNHFEEAAPAGFPTFNSAIDPGSTFGNTIWWYNSTQFGGFDNLFGAQVYSGSESNPIFSIGTFQLTVNSGPQHGAQAVLTIAAIPEPETYAMLLAGLGLMGWVGRRRKLRAA